MNVIHSETELAHVARALAGKQTLTAAERKLLNGRRAADSLTVRAARELIRSGHDPLGEAFLQLRSPEDRRALGAVYTPEIIVNAMVRWAASKGNPARVVDAGCGSGRFTVAAARAFPSASLVACDIDPLAILILRANASVLGFADRLRAEVTEYRLLELERIARPTIYIGNPPYVRHHQISLNAKEWFTRTAAKLNFKASKLAGLHVHFFLRTREIASKGDWGAFITAAEWMDVNYGSVVRQMLADGLGGSSLQVFAPEGMPFADAMTTGVITTFVVGQRPAQFTVRELASSAELDDLESGHSMPWDHVAQCERWSALARPVRVHSEGMVRVGELFRVHRGAVTGSNEVFIEGAYGGKLPQRFLVSTVTKAKELFATSGHLTDLNSQSLRRVISLPACDAGLNAEEKAALERFKRWAQQQGADETYTAKAKRAWWAVKLPEPAPILCTYMARRAPTFVRNLARASHINIAHGLYPRVPMSPAELDTYAEFLRHNVCKSQGRTYAGGLTKFEPREIENLLVPSLETVRGSLHRSTPTPDQPRRVDCGYANVGE